MCGSAMVTGSARASDVDLTQGRRVHESKCARCHKLYDPAAYDDATWDKWMQKMRRKARLNDKQFADLMAYAEAQRAAISASNGTR